MKKLNKYYGWPNRRTNGLTKRRDRPIDGQLDMNRWMDGLLHLCCTASQHSNAFSFI